MQPPIAQKKTATLQTAGHSRVDPYFWLNERDNPEVKAYLEAENEYTAAMMADTKELQNQLFEEIISRIKQDDQTVPYFRNGYFYYRRYEKGAEYPIFCRKKQSMEADEEILINGNELSQGYDYFHVGNFEITPDNKTLAYCVDYVGRRSYTIFFKDLETGKLINATIEGTNGYAAWANDNKTLFYCQKDPETLRSETLMSYCLETNKTKHLYTEDDETFDLMVYRSKSDKMIFMLMFSNTSTEYRYISTDEPDGSFRTIQEREKNMEYQVIDHHDKFYIVTNYQAKNFRLMETSVKNTGKEYWKELVPHREDILLEDVEIFNDFFVLSERKQGLVQLRIKSRHNNDEHYLNFGEEVYTAEISINPSFDTHLLRFSYCSMTTPLSIFDYNMQTREKVLLKQQEVLDYHPEDYVTRRLYAKSPDGMEIPISLVYKKSTRVNAHTPLLLYGYGAYGYNMDPDFSTSRISLLNRGFIYAIAHVRGSQYLGREWYENGKMLNKRNTFTDYITCAEHLIKQGYTDTEHLFGMGASAGGLLIGAVINMRPDLFKGVIAGVPFVDVITTMNDKSIPLTVGEFEEWGNPEDEAYYQYMMSYSPYDNVKAQDYPNMLVTTGFHDSQVQYWEPAKWVAKLRDLKTDHHLLLLYTNMDAGHGGASGRFESYKETALEYAFLLKLLQ
ncbi:MAG: S9 family peptidase [Bacteroidales bacterium]|jgi:oligopeptidase B|nr:S9 family peptidase [Bacteroidales bacterium]